MRGEVLGRRRETEQLIPRCENSSVCDALDKLYPKVHSRRLFYRQERKTNNIYYAGTVRNHFCRNLAVKPVELVPQKLNR